MPISRTRADSAVAICVSDGMRRELGEPENAFVLHDAPSLTGCGDMTRDFKLPCELLILETFPNTGR